MNRVTLEEYKKQLLELQAATTRILSQLEREFSEPEQKTTARRVPEERYNSKRLLIDSGFFNEEEAEGKQAKGLYTFISYYSGQITVDQFKGIVKRVLKFQAEGKVRDKIPYLKNSIKNFVKERGGVVL